MKRLLILFMMLCLILSLVALISCGGNTDTDTNTDTTTDTDSSVSTDTDTAKENDYIITVKDQDGNGVANSKITILDKDEKTVTETTTDQNGQAIVKLTIDTYFVDIAELPEGYLDVVGKVSLTTEENILEVRNNIPNGTMDRPYHVEVTNDIVLAGNETVYYVVYGGGRTLLVENAQGIKLTYGSEEPLVADENGKIEYKMPPIEDVNDRQRIIKIENTTENEISFVLQVVSEKGSIDNPYDIVLDENTKITVEKEKTVYYSYKSQKDGMIVVYSETENNNIYIYNLTTYTTSSYTNGSLCEYVYANEGDEIMVYVSSNAQSNYNKVEFKVSHNAGTEEDPIPLYKATNDFTFKENQKLTFVVTPSALSELLIENANAKLVIGEEEILPDEDGIISYNTLEADKETSFTVFNTNDSDREDVSISMYEIDHIESES